MADTLLGSVFLNSNASELRPSGLTEEEFALLLEDRGFVDYFNVFNSLPIFGQHVFFNFIEKEFEFEPPIRKRRKYVSRRELVKWLLKYRYPLFRKTHLFLEFILCTRIRDVAFDPETHRLEDSEGDDAFKRYIFGRNLFGHCHGMEIFREFLRDTSGENVYRCWMDIEHLNQSESEDVRSELKNKIKLMYISDAGSCELPSKEKYKIYQGFLNFDAVPTDGGKVLREVLAGIGACSTPYTCDSEDALFSLQQMLLATLQQYWVPRYLIHVLGTMGKDVLVMLKRESPGDVGFFTRNRKQRYSSLFPKIYSGATGSLGPTPASHMTGPGSRTSEVQEGTPVSQIVGTSSRVSEIHAQEDTPSDRGSAALPPEVVTGSMHENLQTPDKQGEGENNQEEYQTSATEDSREKSCAEVESDMSINLEEGEDRLISKSRMSTVLETDNENGETEQCRVADDGDRYINPMALISLCGGHKFPTDDVSPSAQARDSDSDSQGLKELETYQKSESTYSELESNAKTPLHIPVTITSYLAGRRRMAMGRKNRSINNRILCALASDRVGGRPFDRFLEGKGSHVDRRYLGFWSDVRQYLDTDDTAIDSYGNRHRDRLAHVISERYLRTTAADVEIFSEGLKMTLFNCLTGRADESLLWSAHDIVTGVLRDPWKEYAQEERKAFRKFVCGKRRYDGHLVEIPPNYQHPVSGDEANDPVYFFNNCQQSGPNGSRSHSRATTPDSRPWSRATDVEGSSVTEEQMWKAFEITLFIVDYGCNGMFSHDGLEVFDLIDNLYSDYGALHIKRFPTKRNDFIRSLVEPPKIDIENVRVSRKVLLDRPDMSCKESEPRYNRLVLRRNGILLERPQRPKTFLEVLNNPVHYDFFKRFMMANRSIQPLFFWSSVEELKEMQTARARHNMVLHIFRRFFSRAAKYGHLLDCTDDIIRQIPQMEKVPASVMICAQASVFRSMERKWYPKYLETYPTDAEYRESMNDSYPTAKLFTQKPPEKVKPKRIKRRKTHHLWHGFAYAILDFLRALKDPAEMKLFEMYLKCETEKDSNAQVGTETKTVQMASLANMKTRVVLKNRLVVIEKLYNDLHFWIEVEKYKSQIENLSRLENLSRNDTDLVAMKAKAIVECFLVSEVLNRTQINIPNDLANSIANSLHQHGPSRGLFHDACIQLFPLLYFFWKKFHEEWLKNTTPKELLPKVEAEMKPRTVTTPHKNESVPDFRNIRLSQVDVTQGVFYATDDDHYRLSFTLFNGLRIVYPIPRGLRMINERQSVVQTPGRKGAKTSQLSIHRRPSAQNSKTKVRKHNAPPVGQRPPADEAKGKGHGKGKLTPAQEKARLLSKLVEELNYENSAGAAVVKENKSQFKSFDEVVEAALRDLRNHDQSPTGAPD